MKRQKAEGQRCLGVALQKIECVTIVNILTQASKKSLAILVAREFGTINGRRKIMYQSPIEIYHKTIGSLTTDIAKRTDEMVVNACLEIGVKVDRDELIKMAKYDRGQYEKGYEDGQVSGAIGSLNTLWELLISTWRSLC